MDHSRAIAVAENILVGHLSFGKQNSEMEKNFKQHKEIFTV